jgi:hypothetical protein
MKRLAAIALAAACTWGTASAQTALPPPTGMKVMTTGGPAAGAVQVVTYTTGPRVGPVKAALGDWTRSPKVWCEDCAPAARRPLPAAPAAGAGGSCAPPRAGCSGSCWERFKEWFCFRQTPVHLGCVPTQRDAPLYTYFPCRETAGCAGGNCGPGGCGPRAGLPHGRKCDAPGCAACPTPGAAVMPGYRLAFPGAGAVPAVTPPAPSEVIPSSFRAPPAAPVSSVPYRR